jgi:hypothetical protein
VGPGPSRGTAGLGLARWRAEPAQKRWRAVLSSFAPIASVSLEYVNIQWTSELCGTVIDPTGVAAGSTLLPVLAAFPVSSGNPLEPAVPVTWFAGSWLFGSTSAGFTAQFLVGPGGAVTLTAGLEYDVISMIEGTPEIPVVFAGVLPVY